MTQWYGILGVIAVVFAGFSTMLVLVVYLEQWLAEPDPLTPASADERVEHLFRVSPPMSANSDL